MTDDSYQQLQRPILEAILLHHLLDFETYLDEIALLAVSED